MTMFLQLDLSEEEMAALNQEATAAGYTVMEYVRLKLGFVQAARQMRDKREVIALDLPRPGGVSGETKDAAEVERSGRRRAGHPPAE